MRSDPTSSSVRAGGRSAGARVGAGLLLVSAIATRTAVAATAADEGKADALFHSAQSHMEKGEYSTACPEFSESENLDPQIGTALNLAYCYEKLGRTATAWSVWLEAAAAAAAKGDREREAFAAGRANRLQAQLLHVTVTVAPQPAGPRMRVAIDRTPLPDTDWGLPVPIDPGQHELSASAAGFRARNQTFTVAKGAEPTLLVPQLDPIVVTGRDAARSGTRGGWNVLVWTSAAAGVAALGTGVGFGVGSLINKNAAESDGNCAPRGCNGAGLSDRSRQREDAVIADVLLATGAAALLSAVVAYVVTRSDRATTSRAWTVGAAPNAPGGATTFISRAW
jgi:hypothetical protein